MDPNNYFSAFLPQYPIQQIPIEHLISSSHQQIQQQQHQQQQQQYSQIFNINNDLFAAAASTNTCNNVMPTLTPISASSIPAASTCYIPSAGIPPPSAAAAIGSTSSSSFLYNNNSFGGNLSLLSNNNLSTSSSSFPIQQSTAALPFQQQPQAQPFVQISLSPSIPQPISVIIDGQQYLEFPSINPGEQSQYIPLQLFLQPQNYISQNSSSSAAEIYQPITAPASNLLSPLQSSISFQSPPPTLQQQQHQIVFNQKQKISKFQQLSSVKMDTTATNEIGSSPATVAAASPVISPPTKTRRTKSPQKRSSNENFNNRLPKNQSSLHRFFTSSQATPSSKNMGELNGGSAAAAISDDDDEDDIQVVSEKISNFGTTISDNECQIIEPKNVSAAKTTKSAAAKSQNKVPDSGDKNTENSVPAVTSSHTADKYAATTAAASTPLSKKLSNASTKQASTSNRLNNITANKSTSSTSQKSSTGPTASISSTSASDPSTSSAAPTSSATLASSATPSVSSASTLSAASTSSDTSTSSQAAHLTTNESSPEPPDPLEFRLQTCSTLNSRVSPTFDYKMTSEIIKEIVPIILEVIPNAIINGIGPAYHECGSFLNLAFDEDTHEIACIWFFFSLSVMIGDKKTKELQIPDARVLEMWINEIDKKLQEEDIVEYSETRMQRGAQKLIFEHKKINAKVTLLFCAEDACKRSQLIRLYTRFHTRMIQVAYLYNNLIVSIPALHLLTNTPICYMIIYFLQQTHRIAVLHQSAASELIDKINLIEPPDYRTEDIQHLISPNPKYSNDSVAFLTYEFAKFYSNFDYDKIIIDISQKEKRFWSKLDAENKKPIAVRCCFSGRNLAGQVTSHCLSTFQKKMKEVVQAFKDGIEATVFPSDLENFRTQR